MQMHKLLAHPLFEERDPKEVLEPFGFDVELHFEDAPCAEEEPEAWAQFEKETSTYVDSINYTPPYGYAEIGRFVNEDSDITIISVRPKSEFSIALLWSDTCFDDDEIEAPINALIKLSDERNRQINGEGFSLDHDDLWKNGELLLAAATYTISAAPADAIGDDDYLIDTMDAIWPWEEKWFKPTTPRRDLVKAGALILAEIERLDRAAAKAQAEEDAA